MEQKINKRMVWVWLALIGGFVIIILLVVFLVYQPKTKQLNVQPQNVKESSSQDLEKEVESIDLGDIESDFQDVEKDINQL